MKKPKMPPMPEVAPAPTPPQAPSMASGSSISATPQSSFFTGARSMISPNSMFGRARAGRKSLLGG